MNYRTLQSLLSKYPTIRRRADTLTPDPEVLNYLNDGTYLIGTLEEAEAEYRKTNPPQGTLYTHSVEPVTFEVYAAAVSQLTPLVEHCPGAAFLTGKPSHVTQSKQGRMYVASQLGRVLFAPKTLDPRSVFTGYTVATDRQAVRFLYLSHPEWQQLVEGGMALEAVVIAGENPEAMPSVSIH